MSRQLQKIQIEPQKSHITSEISSFPVTDHCGKNHFLREEAWCNRCASTGQATSRKTYHIYLGAGRLISPTNQF